MQEQLPICPWMDGSRAMQEQLPRSKKPAMRVMAVDRCAQFMSLTVNGAAVNGFLYLHLI
jgi:hypothetical protein